MSYSLSSQANSGSLVKFCSAAHACASKHGRPVRRVAGEGGVRRYAGTRPTRVRAEGRAGDGRGAGELGTQGSGVGAAGYDGGGAVHLRMLPTPVEMRGSTR
eukprot:2012106-Pleurochrysis_carterae.AAC.1